MKIIEEREKERRERDEKGQWLRKEQAEMEQRMEERERQLKKEQEERERRHQEEQRLLRQQIADQQRQLEEQHCQWELRLSIYPTMDIITYTSRHTLHLDIHCFILCLFHLWESLRNMLFYFRDYLLLSLVWPPLFNVTLPLSRSVADG